MKNWIILSISILLTQLSACTRNKETATEDTTMMSRNEVVLMEKQVETIGIQLGEPVKKLLSSDIRVNGMLDVPPQNLVTIAAPLGGFIKNTHLLQGMYVKKGEALVELQDTEYIQLQQDYLDQQSQLEYAEAEYNRQQTLAKENVNAGKTLQQAKSQFESVRARVGGLKAKLVMINIDPEKIKNGAIQPTIKLYSPIAGYVTEVNVNLGQHVDAADVLFKIVDTSHLHVELYVFEQDIPRLKIGQKVKFNLVNETHQRLAAIHLIGREIDNERTVRVHCHLEEEDKNLLPGMYVKASIETGAREVNTLPEEAIVNFEGATYIFTSVDGKTFDMTAITTGLSQDGYSEVILPGNWDVSRRIVVKGAYELLSKLKNTGEEE